MRISDWSSDVCSSDLHVDAASRSLGRLVEVEEPVALEHEEPALPHLLPVTDAPSTNTQRGFISAHILALLPPKGVTIEAAYLRFCSQPSKIGQASGRERVCKYV